MTRLGWLARLEVEPAEAAAEGAGDGGRSVGCELRHVVDLNRGARRLASGKEDFAAGVEVAKGAGEDDAIAHAGLVGGGGEVPGESVVALIPAVRSLSAQAGPKASRSKVNFGATVVAGISSRIERTAAAFMVVPLTRPACCSGAVTPSTELTVESPPTDGTVPNCPGA